TSPKIKLKQLKKLAEEYGMYVYKKRDGRIVVNLPLGSGEDRVFASGAELEDVLDFINARILR
ncbi:MAG TPA: hypothetical protein V6C63_16840, partial [Allocoleopsis sp.]